MELETRYRMAKPRLLTDQSICPENRQLFAEFFEYEERKLKRHNGLPELDEASFKTLYGYLIRLRNVNRWFGNKPWKDLTESDIRRVYDDLEEGRILTQRGAPFRDRASYYNKILKSKPFALAGRAETARAVIEFSRREEREVRFVTEEVFRRVVGVLPQQRHRLLLWLAWDTGENINTLLQLRPMDFSRQINPNTDEPEYLVRFRRPVLKRSRRERTEPTLYATTVELADYVLGQTASGARLFEFGYRQAKKVLSAAVKKTGAATQPDQRSVTWKDFRSGMACHLLKVGWTVDEVNARLGHAPHSSEIDRYINYLALDRERPKRKVREHTMALLEGDLRAVRRREKLMADRLRRYEAERRDLRREVTRAAGDISRLQQTVAALSDRRSSSSEPVETIKAREPPSRHD